MMKMTRRILIGNAAHSLVMMLINVYREDDRKRVLVANEPESIHDVIAMET